MSDGKLNPADPFGIGKSKEEIINALTELTTSPAFAILCELFRKNDIEPAEKALLVDEEEGEIKAPQTVEELHMLQHQIRFTRTLIEAPQIYLGLLREEEEEVKAEDDFEAYPTIESEKKKEKEASS